MSWMLGKRGATKASASVAKPLARVEDLVVEEVGDEVLVYDRTSDHAHCLSPTAGKVWRACDGSMTREELAASLELDLATVERALEELEECRLLDTGVTGVTRREVTARMVKLGAVGAAAPLIWSIVGPVPEAAATVTVAGCAAGSLTHGCGVNCQALNCCCCCQGLATTVCGNGDTKCCYPATLCPGLGGHCSDTAPCP